MSDRKRDDVYAQTTIIVPSYQAVQELWPVGSLIDGQYKVVAIRGGAGVSGMGVVYIIERDGVRRAAKTFQRQFAGDLPLIQRFMREAETWMLIDVHPNIVRAHYLDIIETVPFIFMEFIERDEDGCLSLADHIARGKLPYTKALDFAIQCCEGMIHATSAVPGLVHRDLKPENLLIAPDGTLKITDFGLVRWHMQEAPVPDDDDGSNEDDRRGITRAGSSLGTPAYMAPEQFLAPGRVEIPADIYAFGCILYEVITGQRLFTIRATSDVERMRNIKNAHLHQKPIPLKIRTADCPHELNDVVMRCLEKDPCSRWLTFQDLKERLCDILEHEFGVVYTPRRRQMLSPGEVADQVRSLRLLDGYSRAIQSKALREDYPHSAYSFHLALASYFHAQRDLDEEQRQLERALRVRAGHEGHEAVRRLADLHVFRNELNEADRLLDMYTTTHPDDAHAVLEPLVRLRVAQGRFDDAYAILAQREPVPGVLWLEWEVASAARDAARAVSALDKLMQLHRDNLLVAMRQVVRGQVVGVDADGDVAAVKQVLEVLEPACDVSVLDTVLEAPWPAMSGYPDFAADLAFLSRAAGELAQTGTANPAADPAQARAVARLLGYPGRHERFLQRDEEWLWSSGY